MSTSREQPTDSDQDEEAGAAAASNNTEDANSQSNALLKVLKMPLTNPLDSAKFLYNHLTETATFEPPRTLSNKIARWLLGSLAGIASLCITITLSPISLLMGLYWEDDPVSAGAAVLVISALAGSFISAATLTPTIPYLGFIWWQQIHALMGGPLLGLLGVTSPFVPILFPLVLFVFRVIVPAMQNNSLKETSISQASQNHEPKRSKALDEELEKRVLHRRHSTSGSPEAEPKTNPLRRERFKYFFENKPGDIIYTNGRDYFQFKDSTIPMVMINKTMIDDCDARASSAAEVGLGLGLGLGGTGTASIRGMLPVTNHDSQSLESKRATAGTSAVAISTAAVVVASASVPGLPPVPPQIAAISRMTQS